MNMNQNQQRASAFIHRLLANPALKQYTPLQKEEQVSQFLSGNIQQLGPTLMSPAFFPGMPLEQIQQLLQSILSQMTNERLLPALKGIVQRIDFSFVQFLRQQQTRPSTIQDQVLRFLEQNLRKMEMRRAFSGPYTALHYDFSTKYINEAFRMHRHIYFELTKVQRLKMSKEEIKSYVEVTILLRAIVQAMGSGAEDPTIDSRSGLISNNYARTLVDQLKGELTMLPPQVISSAVNSNVSFLENSQVETTGRIAAVLAARAKQYLPGIKVDRGADTPDKSWLNIARRNYKFYGFDIKMLDEMYMIAAENGW
jgi:hypothetical protein